MVLEKMLYILLVTVAIIFPVVIAASWLTVFWFLEGITIIFIGLLLKKMKLEKCGWIMLGIGLTAFYIGNWLRNLMYVDSSFVHQYSIVIGGCALTLLIYLYVNSQSKAPGSSETWRYVSLLRRVTVIGGWVYLQQTLGDLYFKTMPRGFYFEFFRTMLMLFIHMSMGFFILHSPLTYDRVIGIFGCFCLIFGIGTGLWIDFTVPLRSDTMELGSTVYTALVIVGLANVALIVAVRGLYMGCKNIKKIHFR